MRRAFLESYLDAMGDASTKQDVDALLIDVTLAACGHHFGPNEIFVKIFSCAKKKQETN